MNGAQRRTKVRFESPDASIGAAVVGKKACLGTTQQQKIQKNQAHSLSGY